MQGSNWIYVAASYAAAWLAIGGYAIHLYRATSRARRALWHATGPTSTEGSWR